MIYKTLNICTKSNRTLEHDYELKNLLAVHSFLIQDISLDNQRCCHYIQNSCTFLLCYLDMLGFFIQSVLRSIILAVIYIILYGLYFGRFNRNKSTPLL